MTLTGRISAKTHLSAVSFFVFHEAQMRLKVVLVSWQLFPYCLGTSILFLRRRRQNLLERPVVQNMAIRVVEFSNGDTKLETFLPKNQHQLKSPLSDLTS
jgi:hypothetical protein